MKRRYSKIVAIGLVSCMLFSGCANSSNSGSDVPNPDVSEPAEVKTSQEASEESETNETTEKSDTIETTEKTDITGASDESDTTGAPEESSTTTAPEESDITEVPTEQHTAGKYPIKWELDTIYAGTDEWYADYDKVMELLPKYNDYRGKLNNAENIYDYIVFSNLSELTRLQEKLNGYVFLGESLDPTSSVFNELNSKLNVMFTEEKKLSAFANPEIYSLSLEERKKIFSDPIFKDMQYFIRDYIDPDYKPLSEEENNLIATMAKGQGYAANIYNILNYVELPDPKIIMPDGTETELTSELYNDIIHSSDYDEDFKAEANKIIITKYKGLTNTLTALLEENCQQAYAGAQIYGYDTTLESAMAQYDLDTAVFDMLIDAAHDGTEDYQRYLNIHKKGLGLDKQFPFNLGTYVSDFNPGKIEYDAGVDEVIDALSILGDDYTDLFTEIISSGQVDVYPNDTKSTGAFQMKFSNGYLPWVLFNYTGYSNDVSTIAHEMGHAVYSELATRNQPVQYSCPTIFTQEVASTTNELLYYTYKMNNAGDDDEKLYYLENTLSKFSGTFFSQMMQSEFEDYLYKQVEGGFALDAQKLGDKWIELLDEYRGDGVTNFPDNRYQWASIEHLYAVYYMYQYAAAIAYGASIAERITSGEEGAAEEYKAFLKLGESASPVELLKEAGIDPLSKETYDYALQYYKKLVDEYERLVDEKLSKNS